MAHRRCRNDRGDLLHLAGLEISFRDTNNHGGKNRDRTRRDGSSADGSSGNGYSHSTSNAPQLRSKRL